MPWDPTKPAGTDAANTIDDSVVANNQAIDTWASAITDGIAAAGATFLRFYKSALTTILKTRSAAGDTVDRFTLDTDGKQSWGSGGGAADVVLERGGANYLQLASGDHLRVQQDPSNANDAARKSYVDALGVGADSPFRVVRGRFDTTGPTTAHGAGFTLGKNGTGDVTITFSTAFGGVPAVVGIVSREVGGSGFHLILRAATTVTTARFWRLDTNNVPEDGMVEFIAIGPR